MISFSKLNNKSYIFFLPIKTRPDTFPKLIDYPKDHTFWHTGIIYNNYIYQLFNFGRYQKTPLTKEIYNNLVNQKAIILNSNNINISKINSELLSKTSCGTYVGRVLDLDNSIGDIKTLYPDDTYILVTNNLSYSNTFNNIKSIFKSKYNWNVDYLNYKISDIPVYNNGKINSDMDPLNFAGCWTKNKTIVISPPTHLLKVIKHYKANRDIKSFLTLIFAHEMCHEVYNNILNNKTKQYYIDLKNKINFSTEYLDKIINKINPSKFNEEWFCEYIATQILNNRI